MSTLYRLGFNLVAGFDFDKHKQVALLSLGVLQEESALALVTLVKNGFTIVHTYPSTILHGGRHYDWVNIEAYIPSAANPKMQILKLAKVLSTSPGFSVYNLTVAHFWQQLVAGSIGIDYFDGNKNYWTPVDGQLPFNIDSKNPDAYAFIGLTNVALGDYLSVTVVHTSPGSVIRNKFYDVEDLKNRTSGTAYLSPLSTGEWIYGETGQEIINLSKTNNLNLAGFIVPNEDVERLLQSTPRNQFIIALVARAWRNKYGSMSADIFRTIINSPAATAERIGYDYLDTVDHFNHLFE